MKLKKISSKVFEILKCLLSTSRVIDHEPLMGTWLILRNKFTKLILADVGILLIGLTFQNLVLKI
ncbi:MAG: hypothetical protein D8M61_02605 [Ignavibacteriae bacterium]|nr:hypothetical protein [Ignavibacteriota bacterium]